MAQLSNITLPNGNKYGLKGSIYTVIGTQTAATGSWTGELKSLDALYDGLTIMYWLPFAGSGNATLNLTLSSGTTGAINCYYNGNNRLTTHYGQGTMILMTYWSAGKIKVGATATTDARWVTGPNRDDGNTIPVAYCSTAAGTSAKACSFTSAAWGWGTTYKGYAIVDMYYGNTAQSALTFNVGSIGAKPIYINGVASSASNYTLPAGQYIARYDGTNWYFRTDGLLPLLPAQVEKGLTVNGDKIGHSNSVTAGTAGTSSATSGSTLAVPYVTYDAQGHVTAAGTHTHTVTGFLTSSSSLDATKLTGTISSNNLPSYVDDVLEYNGKSNFPSTGEAGKIYVDTATNLTYRWSGSAYVEISPSLALGSTASTAAKGNHTHSFTPAGTIAVQTAGTTTTITPVTKKTVVTGGTTTDVPNISKKTVVVGGTTTDVPNISKKTVVTAASGATATISGCTLTLTNGSFTTGDSVTVGTAIKAYTGLTTGDSVTVGTAIKAYTSLTTGDSVTAGTAVTVKTGDAAYKFTGSAGTTGAPA